MELKINDYQLPQPIEFNYEEIKAWVQEQTEAYKGMIYDDTQISQAKSDRANLRRTSKLLNDRRISLEKEYMQPFFEFKEKINDLIKLIDEPANLIDQRIKEFEEQKREEKREQIGEMFDGIEQKPDWLKLEQIWNPKWLNATTSMKSISREISGSIEAITENMNSLNSIEGFAFEAKEVYKQTLDMPRAIAEGRRLQDIQKRKEEEEARKAAEAERQKKVDSIINNPTSQIINRAEAREAEEKAQMATWVSFRALLTMEQAKDLKQFFGERGIRFEPIQ